MYKKIKSSQKYFFILVMFIIMSTPNILQAKTYYIRPDGGTANQCTGLVDAPYPGSGSNKPCAWKHIFEALPPKYYKAQPRITGGDTIIIKKGTYIMGRHKGYEGAGCEATNSYACFPKPLPSGPDPQHPTRILGEGWNNGCNNPPKLIGVGKTFNILNLTNTSNAVIQCLEITDGATCGDNYKGSQSNLKCGKKPDGSYMDWAQRGIYSGTASKPYNNSKNVLLKNLYIHGLGGEAINAAHLTDWTIEDTRLIANARAAFNGDVPPAKGDNDEFYGTIAFKNVEIGWTGCIEDKDTGKIVKCYDQQKGGYGDAIGTGPSGNAAWIFDNVYIHHNTSDGIDLLYFSWASNPQVKIINSRIEGNAGNGIKVAGAALIMNNEIIGNCDYWHDKPFNDHIIRCRGGGAALAVDLSHDAKTYVVNNTFLGEAPAIISIAGAKTYVPGQAHIYFFNNLLVGLARYNNPSERADWMYAYDFNIQSDLSNAYWAIYHSSRTDRYNLPNTEGTTLNVDPLLVKIDSISDQYDLRIRSQDSPIIGKGMKAGTFLGLWGKFNEKVNIPSIDKEGILRTGKTCYGAHELSGASKNQKPEIELKTIKLN